MNDVPLSTYDSTRARFRLLAAVTYLALVLLWCAVAYAQDPGANSASSSETRVIHVLGFQNAPNNSSGRLSIDGDDLQFQKGTDAPVRIKISSIRDFSVGEIDKQVGGVPMKVGKAAVPFGGGRAVSLFSHKRYETLRMEYSDSSGGLHGAVFQLNKGEAFTVALAAKGVHQIKPAETKAQASPSGRHEK